MDNLFRSSRPTTARLSTAPTSVRTMSAVGFGLRTFQDLNKMNPINFKPGVSEKDIRTVNQRHKLIEREKAKTNLLLSLKD